MRNITTLVLCMVLTGNATAQLREAPDVLADATITGEESLIAIIDELYPHFGFGDTESLVYQFSAPMGETTSYHFLEHINDIPTEHIVTIIVEDSKAIELLGNVIADSGFSTDHMYTEQEAIEAVIEHVANVEDQTPVLRNSGNRLFLVYRTLADPEARSPWWHVELSGIGTYLISPEGDIENAFDNALQ